MHDSIKDIMFVKNLVIKFEAKCRDTDRQYEMNNCWELDNGVYNKFVNNSPHDDDSKGEDEKDDQSNASRSDLHSKHGKKKKKPLGADAFLNDSLESSFKDSTLKSMEDDQVRRKNINMLTEEDDEEEDHVRKMKELLLADKAQAHQIQRSDTEDTHYSFVVDQRIVTAVCRFGYAQQYVIKCLEKNEANY